MRLYVSLGILMLLMLLIAGCTSEKNMDHEDTTLEVTKNVSLPIQTPVVSNGPEVNATEPVEAESPETLITSLDIGSCDRTNPKPDLNISITSGRVDLHQVMTYVCCANLTMHAQVDEGTLKVYYDNVAEMCRCTCSYEVNAVFAASVHEVEVYGVLYINTEGVKIDSYELIGKYPLLKDREKIAIKNVTLDELVASPDAYDTVSLQASLRMASENYYDGEFYLEAGFARMNVTNWLGVESLCTANVGCPTMRDFIDKKATYVGYVVNNTFHVLNATLVGVATGAECESDSDCVPGKCCHARICVPQSLGPDCSSQLCTLNCEGGTMDCGQGSCACVNGKCTVDWKYTTSLKDEIR